MKINFKTFKIPYNYILIKVGHHHDELKIGELSLKVGHGFKTKDTGNWETKYYNIKAEVVAVCENFRFNKELIKKYRATGNQIEVLRLTESSMDYLPEKEVKKGDEVIFHYAQFISATNEGRSFTVDGIGRCMLIPYDMIFACNDNPVNGWIWIKRKMDTEAEILPSGIYIPGSNYQKHPIAEVVKVSKPIIDYLADGWDDSKVKVSVGDKIYYNVNMQAPIEHEYYQSTSIFGFWKIRRKDIFFLDKKVN